jgi:hypothetical protein
VHTLYELDRLAGRYDGLADERGRPRTVFALGRNKPFDLFDLVRRFGRLSVLVDAEYGSATFDGARGFAAYEILVSTSGLLARPVAGTRFYRGCSAYFRGFVQIAASLLTVPVVEVREDALPFQMAQSVVTWLLSTSDRAPAFPPQMAP